MAYTPLPDDGEKDGKMLNDVERFSENCFLFDNIQTLAIFNQALTLKGIEPYKNFAKINDEPGWVIQEFLGKKGMEAVFSITPAQIALIVPTIQLFKVDYSKNKKKGDDIPFVFQDFTSPKIISDILNNRSGRGEDAGIKSFEYEFAGKNPAEGGLITAKLSLYFNSPKALLGDAESGIAPFRDLVYYPSTNKEKTSCDAAYNSKNFRIKVIVGWADIIDPKGMLIPTNSPLRKSINRMKIVLFLHLTSHDIDFKENGILEVNLTYRGAIEGILTGEASDIFWITETGKSAQALKEKQAKSIADKEKKANTETQASKPPVIPSSVESKKISYVTGGTEEENREYLIAQGEEVDKQIRYSRLINSLWSRGRVFYVDVDDSAISLFNDKQRAAIRDKSGKLTAEQLRVAYLEQRNQDAKNDAIAAKAKAAGKLESYQPRVNKSVINVKRFPIGQKFAAPIVDALEASKTFVTGQESKTKSVKTTRTEEERQKALARVENHDYTKMSGSNRRIIFFFLGDLIDTALSVLMDDGRTDNHNVKALLGPYVFEDPRTGNRITYNLADVPISLSQFYSWYINKVIKAQRSTYYLGEFIKDVLSELVIDMLKPDSCYSQDRKNAPHIGVTLLTVPNLKDNIAPGGWYTLKDLKDGTLDGKVGSSSSHYDMKDLAHYLYIYVVNETISTLRGNYDEDVKNGIYHIVLGADNGLVKSVKFSKNNTPYAKEALATNDTVDQHRVPGYYNANITMVGNSLFNVGTRIYIDTRRLTYGGTTDLATSMRIGGYYLIIKVNNVVSKDDFVTEITAKWDQNANGANDSACVKKAAKEKVKSNETERMKVLATVRGEQAEKPENKLGQSSSDVQRALNTK